MDRAVPIPETGSSFNVTTGGRLHTSLRSTPLIWGLSDVHLLLLIPTVVHWSTSAIFEIIDRAGWLQAYRLHTSAEELKKNHVSRRDCFINVVRCQLLQSLLGLALCWGTENDIIEDYDRGVARWTRRVQATFTVLAKVLHLNGTEYKRSGTIAGDNTRALASLLGRPTVDISEIEAIMGNLLYWHAVPLFQLTLALLVADAWMYVLHRQVHKNKWLYRNVHSLHHHLYVPYSWGGAYGHIFDNIVVDGFAYTLACWVANLSSRLAMILFAYSSFKNVVDHAGYVFKWDPIHAVTGTGCDFHDVHHQPWGLKTNFGLHFALWDRMMGTLYDDPEKIASHRAKSRITAKAHESGMNQRKLKHEDFWKETQEVDDKHLD